MSKEITITISAETVAMIDSAFAMTKFSGREAVRIKRAKAQEEWDEATKAAGSAK